MVKERREIHISKNSPFGKQIYWTLPQPVGMKQPSLHNSPERERERERRVSKGKRASH